MFYPFELDSKDTSCEIFLQDSFFIQEFLFLVLKQTLNLSIRDLENNGR